MSAHEELIRLFYSPNSMDRLSAVKTDYLLLLTYGIPFLLTCLHIPSFSLNNLLHLNHANRYIGQLGFARNHKTYFISNC
tara:strand:+ start:1029 stop:1268 length:240 start_codon:yes stop_codon:yes gene_type:complete